MKILSRIEKSVDFWSLLIFSLFFFLLRFPSLFEPDWYGDEGIYQVLGLGIRAGRLLYRDIFDNKPPLLYVLYSFVYSDQFAIRLLSLLFGVLSVIIFYFLSKKLFHNLKATIIATFAFSLLFGLPLVEGNIANAENFMLLPNLIAGLLIFKSISINAQKTKYKIQFLAGLILGISFLIKIVGLFDFAAFFTFLFFINYSQKLFDIFKKENFLKELKNLLSITLGFLIPILFTALYFAFNHAFSNFLTATFFSNIGYVGYGNKFIIPQGLLILKLVLLAGFCLFLFFKKEKLGLPFVFISLWLGFSLFDAFFSQRPYTHYVLMILPAFCLMLGLSFTNKIHKLALVLTIASLILVTTNFTFYIKTIFYYQNFIAFVTGNKSVINYQKFFDSNTPNDYEIASYLSLHLTNKDDVFIWGNNAQVYKLINKLPPGRYAVAYHITSYKDGLENTANALRIEQPKFIVIMPNVAIYPFSLSGYREKVSINNILIYEKFYQ